MFKYEMKQRTSNFNTEQDWGIERVDAGLAFYDADDKTRKKIDYTLNNHGIMTQIENVLFAETGFDHDNRSILSALAGIGKNTLDWERRAVKWFEAGKTAIATALCEFHPEMRENLPQSNKDRVDRYLEKLFADQDEKGIVWLDKRSMPFDKKTKMNPPNQYKLLYQEYAAEAFYRAYTSPDRYQDGQPGTTWEKAAREVAAEWMEELGRTRPQPHAKKKYQRPSDAAAVTKGTIRRYARMQVEKHGVNHTHEELINFVNVVMAEVAIELKASQSINDWTETE
jgi:hypothetical protein